MHSHCILKHSCSQFVYIVNYLYSVTVEDPDFGRTLIDSLKYVIICFVKHNKQLLTIADLFKC